MMLSQSFAALAMITLTGATCLDRRVEAFSDVDLVIRDGLIALSRSERPPAQTRPSVSDELNAMADEDQEIRRRFIQDQSNRALEQQMVAMDRRHVARLREIINEHGWPTFTMVGKKAANSAWLIAQHGGKEFLDEVLPLMKAALDEGEMLGANYVRSVDRSRIQNGLKQIYGSQFDTDDGRCAVMPIEDREHVDERRKESGLEPLADYARKFCAMFKREPSINP